MGCSGKDFTRSLLRSHWRVRDVSGTELLETHESSWTIALLRRVAGLLPNGWRRWVPFTFVLRRDGCEVGTTLGARKAPDRYVLEVTPSFADVDRSPVAFAVGLDALQDR